MLRFAAVFLAVALLIYGLVDCAQTKAAKTRYMPKAVWLVLIVILPVVGPIAWLLFGKNRETGTPAPRRRAPDEDPDFLWKLDRDVKRDQARAESERLAHEVDDDDDGPETDRPDASSPDSPGDGPSADPDSRPGGRDGL